jgi:hypothetical protein
MSAGLMLFEDEKGQVLFIDVLLVFPDKVG